MSAPNQHGETGGLKRAAAFGVHLLTAAGAALALLALLAAIENRWTLMFVWLGLALIVDAVDGTFARLARVKEVLPRWSGDVLDLVVDILTYVFVPSYAIAVAGLLPAAVALPLAFAIVMTSVIYFADRRMKSPDNYFMGFPATWNLVAFYLFLWRPAPWAAAVLIVGLCVVMFVRIPFLHPLRVAKGRMFNLLLLAVGAVLAATALAQDLAPGPFVTVALSLLGVYFLACGFWQRNVQA